MYVDGSLSDGFRMLESGEMLHSGNAEKGNASRIAGRDATAADIISSIYMTP